MADAPRWYRTATKVNLLLRVGSPAPDGFHPVLTVLASLDLGDRVALDPGQPELLLEVSRHDDLPELALGAPEENLVHRAARAALKAWGEEHRGLGLYLFKAVPHQAGLGGGSADAAATLIALRDWLRPELPLQDLEALAATLGADVPFFLRGGYARGTGRGDQLEVLPSTMRLPVLVWKPEQGIGTADAYQELDAWRRDRPADLTARDAAAGRLLARWLADPESDPSELQDLASNDFQAALVPSRPWLAAPIAALAGSGAIITLLSGSGSAVVGFYADEPTRDKAAQDLAARHPKAWIRAATTGGPGVIREEEP